MRSDSSISSKPIIRWGTRRSLPWDLRTAAHRRATRQRGSIAPAGPRCALAPASRVLLRSVIRGDILAMRPKHSTPICLVATREVSRARPTVRTRTPLESLRGYSLTLSARTRLGPYEILSPLGAGGRGEVYRAGIRSSICDVAIKVLRSRSPAIRTHWRDSSVRRRRSQRSHIQTFLRFTILGSHEASLRGHGASGRRDAARQARLGPIPRGRPWTMRSRSPRVFLPLTKKAWSIGS